MARTGNPGAHVAVIGAGIAGLSVAWRAAALGFSVTVLERGAAAQGTSRVAAGMLAPVSEAEFGEHGRRLLDLGLRSASLWPAFAAELEQASGLEVGLRRTGTLMVAHDEDEARELERQLTFRQSLGLRAVRLRPSEAREREPALAPTIRMAVEAPDDHSVDPRVAMAALRAACERAGAEIREGAEAGGFELDGDGSRVTGVRLRDGSVLEADEVVVAAGCWSGALEGLPDRARVAVRPVKGQIMLLRDPCGPGLLTRALRYAGGYVVPRGDGRYVLGATMEERGFEPQPTAGAVYELLRAAYEVLPGIAELELIELNVGFRPGTPDNTPAIGRGALDGLVWATGHHRNGILLAPVTAELVVEELLGHSEHEAPSVPQSHEAAVS